MKNKKSASNPIPVILHGEAMIYPSSLPKNVKKIQPSNKNFHIIADSETTGNHHVVDLNDDMEFFMDENGQMYMKNEKETQVRCVMENRHGTIPIPPGTWEFGMQQEYDHFAQHLRNVRD